MRFLADETVWGSLVRELTVRGHDVYLAKAEGAGSSDDHWLRFAADTQRILLTEDNDFGHLVFASGYSA